MVIFCGDLIICRRERSRKSERSIMKRVMVLPAMTLDINVPPSVLARRGAICFVLAARDKRHRRLIIKVGRTRVCYYVVIAFT